MTGSLERLTLALAGRYRVERELGAGGMATVYLADDVKHDRRVAIKVLRQDLAASLGAERFHREIKIAAALQHPHILPLYDSGDADGLLFYVMPYVSGTSLRQKLTKEGELPVTDAVRILHDVADALAAAHEHGVVHRDLKPENVMLSGRHALVTDFGVAKALSEATGRQTLTTIGVALGTPTYMAPEQATADPHLDHRADIYAFGVMAYELLTGRPPFTGHAPQEILAAHVTAAAVPITNHRASIPPVLATLVMRCLEKKPADRWQRADELLPQLEAVLTPSGGMTPSETRPFEAVASPIRRRWPLVAAAVVGLAIIAAGASWAVRSRDAPLDQARILVVPFEMPANSPDLVSLQQRLESGIVQGLQRTGLGTATDSRTAIGETAFSDTSSAELSTATVARRLAREIGAGLAVMGRIIRNGDLVQVEAKLLGTSSGTEVVAIPTESGPLAGSELVNAVAQRLMGALAMHRDTAWWGSSLPGARAPTYAAYRALQEGAEHFNRAAFPAAAKRWREAYFLDTTFTMAALRYGNALFNAQDYTAVDSLAAALEPRRSTMSPYETQYLNRQIAWNHGDLQAFYTAAREMARIAWQSRNARYNAARSAIYVNRMEEARAGLLTFDAKGPALYGDLCDALHALSDHEAELKWARELIAHPRNQRPVLARSIEAVALVGLGRVGEIDPLFSQLLVPGREGETIRFALRVVGELSWHGHDSTARRLSRIALDRAGATISANDRLSFLAFGREYERAGALADSLLRADTASGAALFWVGALAAARGDSASARATLSRLERLVRPYDNGVTTRARAEILALLGDKDQAVQLLLQAFNEGIPFVDAGFHARFGLEPLRGFPAFEAFVKPK